MGQPRIALGHAAAAAHPLFAREGGRASSRGEEEKTWDVSLGRDL